MSADITWYAANDKYLSDSLKIAVFYEDKLTPDD